MGIGNRPGVSGAGGHRKDEGDSQLNWQSEFLAVGSIAVFSIYLRQRGSSQSKPVGAAHGETATEG